MRRRRTGFAGLLVALVVVASGGLAGCAVVRPWERGALVSRCARPPFDARGGAFAEHVRGIREGVAGATGQAGASCGCN
ncbi:MAG: DUF4266 domain-containing protein [Deltaproteobacteria bacterium]|nr:DUF4266 domain-containing protein [Deltaproteobacteria bacterium]